MAEGFQGLGAPLNNQELQQHVQMQAAHHTDPTSPGYVGDAQARIHGASYDYVDSRLANAQANLVSDQHELNAEELEDELDELSSWLDFDISALRKALRDPVKARQLIRAASSRTPPPVKNPSALSLEEVHHYLRSLERDKAAESKRDKELHEASLAVLGTLVDDWRRGPLTTIGEASPNNRETLAHSRDAAHSYGPGIPSLETHISSKRSLFERVTKETIHELGEAAVDASGARERIAAFLGVEPDVEKGEKAPVQGAMTQEELERAKAQHQRLNVSTGGRTTPVKSLPSNTEKFDDEVAAEAARNVLDPPKNKVERLPTVEIPLFNDIVAFTKGKVHLNTDVINGFRSLGDGDTTHQTRDTAIGGIPCTKDVEHVSRDYTQHLNEAVSFSTVVEPDTITVRHAPEPAQKKRFGRAQPVPGPTFTDEPNPSAGQPIRIEHDGVEEPTVRFRYQFAYSVPAINSHELPRYKEFRGGREGQHIQIGVDLPESLAHSLEQQIEDDPASARDLAEHLFLENNDGVLTEELWYNGGDSHNPIRPPYEELPPGWNIAVVRATEIGDRSCAFKKDYTIDRKPVRPK